MLKSYFKIALRNLLRDKIYSAINLLGLATGIACAVLILFFIKDELSYDNYHTKLDRIYRLSTEMNVGGNNFKLAASSFPMAAAVKEDFPEIEQSARIIQFGNPLIKYGDNYFYENKFYWADSNVFEIFSYELLKGNPETALAKPNSLVITEEMAEKYFGNENPVGKTITYESQIDFIVTGVLKNLPKNSTLQFDFLASFSSLKNIVGQELLENWHAFFYIYTFILLKDGTNPAALEARFPEFISSRMGDEILQLLGREYKLSLMPLSDIYLRSDRRSEMGKTGDITYVYVFAIVAVFIVILACINFMNLMIARSTRRVKEIGLRKVFGAFSQQLIYQFIGESLIISFLALPLAFIFVEVFLPVFNSISNKEMALNFSEDFLLILSSIVIVTLVGLFSGSYPALFLSKLMPSRAVRGEIKIGNSRNVLRQALIVFQFVVSIVLLIGTITVYNQLDYMQNKKIGINKEQVIVLQSTDQNIDAKYKFFSDNLLQNSNILEVASSSYMPGTGIVATPYRFEGGTDEQKWEITTLPVNYNFIKTLGIELIAGRDYSKNIASDTVSSFIINEQAVKTFGYESPEKAIGQRVIWLGTDSNLVGNIVGVVKDFNYGSLEKQINALVFVPENLWPGGLNYIALKASPENMSSTISFIEETWERTFPSIPFRYSFMDENFSNLYQSEMQLGKIFTVFAVLAMFIACLGLLGLVNFLAEVRTKEIGIRKILGSSVSGIVTMISKEFLKLVIVANIIAWPLSYYLMENWLEDFAYRIDFQVTTLIMTGLITAVITVITVSMQSIKAALKNPIKSIKQE